MTENNRQFDDLDRHVSDRLRQDLQGLFKPPGGQLEITDLRIESRPAGHGVLNLGAIQDSLRLAPARRIPHIGIKTDVNFPNEDVIEPERVFKNYELVGSSNAAWLCECIGASAKPGAQEKTEYPAGHFRRPRPASYERLRLQVC